jgi:hypothetical protein
MQYISQGCSRWGNLLFYQPDKPYQLSFLFTGKINFNLILIKCILVTSVYKSGYL